MNPAQDRQTVVTERQGHRGERVLVLDFGAQYVQLIVRKVRALNVYAEIRPYNTPVEELLAEKPRGIILSGGPASVYEDGAPKVDRALFEAGIPVLGICYGQQLMAQVLGGVVSPGGSQREYGRQTAVIERPGTLLEGCGEQMQVWMSHGDKVTRVPDGFQALAHTEHSPVAAMGDESRHLYGVQFHPEVHHTPLGQTVLGNFLKRACGCSGDWKSSSFIEEAVEDLRARIGDDRVLCALSGGVDSSVCAALLDRAVGDRLLCMFIDHGLMRKNEPEQVREFFGNLLGERFVAIDASDRFLSKLEGVEDPEAKRKIIGETFIRTFEEESEKLGDFRFIAHGTLYPDVIESGGSSGATDVIKTHHNVGGLPEDMKHENLEPLRWLFKDECRRAGLELGLPEEIVWRQPFPGPGLAVRIIGSVDRERLALVREADAIVREELKAAGLERSVSQCFAVLATMRSVGVMGDGRTYGHPIIVRAVETDDFMTADWVRIPHEVLARISNRITNEIRGINRVVYDITSKPPGTIEWE
jgi:GMP synthase (glutamine-hydrolysing)